MRRHFSLLFCLIILYTVLMPAQALAAQGDLGIAAKACALVDAASGRVLYQQNGDVPLPMASTTKVMTALVVLENAKLSDIVEISRSASGVEGSSIYLEVGEKLSVEQLLLGLMLRSGNDAAVALAEHVGGSVEGFVGMMNDKALSMGLEHTLFQNPHGLPAQDHYTSALDLCAIMSEAIGNEDFVRIASTKKVQIPWEGHQWNRVLTNKNRMLDELTGCNGGKTGFTKAAGRCLVEAAERDGMQLVSVVLNCPDWWNQTAKMMEYGFDNYYEHVFLERGEAVHQASTGGSPESVAILAQETLSLAVSPDEEMFLRLEVPAMPAPPYREGDILGTATAIVDGEARGSVCLVAGESVIRNGALDVAKRIFGKWMGKGKEI